MAKAERVDDQLESIDSSLRAARNRENKSLVSISFIIRLNSQLVRAVLRRYEQAADWHRS